MWKLDCEESWVPKNWCFWTVVLEKTLESPLDCKEIQPVHSKGNQFWVFTERIDAEAETLILWPPHVKSWLIGKDSGAGRDWGQEEKQILPLSEEWPVFGRTCRIEKSCICQFGKHGLSQVRRQLWWVWSSRRPKWTIGKVLLNEANQGVQKGNPTWPERVRVLETGFPKERFRIWVHKIS